MLNEGKKTQKGEGFLIQWSLDFSSFASYERIEPDSHAKL